MACVVTSVSGEDGASVFGVVEAVHRSEILVTSCWATRRGHERSYLITYLLTFLLPFLLTYLLHAAQSFLRS